ncbi:MAG: transporter [Gemmatimonadales bacterium]
MTKLRIAGLVLGAVAGLAAPARAQFDGARIYWTLPINTNILGVTTVRGTINAAWTNFQRIEPSVRVNNNLYLLSYSRTFGLFGRSAMATLMLPAGAIGTDASTPPGAGVASEFVHGVGDPSLGLWVNLVGAPRQRVRDFVRYEQGTTVALSFAGKAPVGQYDAGSTLNIGSNQWKAKLGLPIVQGLGSWTPGSRMTLEVLPSVTFSGDNGDALGQTIAQDPTIAVESHLTRDVTKRAFVSLDYTYLRLGQATYTDNTTGMVSRSSNAVGTHLVGVTAGFEINDNMRLFVTHQQTASSDVSNVDLQGELLKVTLSWSWHTVLERLRDLK